MPRRVPERPRQGEAWKIGAHRNRRARYHALTGFPFAEGEKTNPVGGSPKPKGRYGAGRQTAWRSRRARRFLKERQVNTLMTNAKNTRGKYTASGYRHSTQGEEKPLYIARVPAGSPQEELIDHNLPGYRVERPWRETPTPLFETGDEQAAAPKQAPRARRAPQREGIIDRLAREAGKDRGDVAACIVIGAVILLLVAAWGQKMVASVNIQESIESYQKKTIALERENERLEQQLELAQSGERIRNLAQNELGMLRPERAEIRTIYIQTGEDGTANQVQKQEKPKLGVLDILLGLLDVLHIGE